MSILIAEFLGTALMILLGNGVVANAVLNQTKGHQGGWIVISAGWAFAVAISIYIVGWMSGGHLNPIVTLSFALTGTTPWSEVGYYWIGQFTGAFVGGLLVYVFYKNHFKQTENRELKLVCFCTKPQILDKKNNFLSEMIGTIVLILGVLGIFDVHNGIGCGVGPYLVGVLIWSIGLSLGGTTGYAINPARDWGPRLAHTLLKMPNKGSSEWNYAIIPMLGPIVGALIAVGIYLIVFKDIFHS
jgi:glycerol uptake facilitator protein